MPQQAQSVKPIIDEKELLYGMTDADDPMRTGKGMDVRAIGAARQSLAEKVKPNYAMALATGREVGPEGQSMELQSMQPGLPSPAKDPQVAAAGQAASMLGGGLEAVGTMGPRVIPRLAASIAGGVAGGVGGGKAGHYLGGIPGRMLTDKKMEEQGAGLGEGIGATAGGFAGGVGGWKLGGMGGIPLKMKIAGVPIEGEMPMRGVGRSGSAGDLASWQPEDLWAGYMKNRGTPQGEAIAREIQRRGLTGSPAGTYRPPTPMASIEGQPQRLVDKVQQGGEDVESMVRRRPTGRPQPQSSAPSEEAEREARFEQYRRITKQKPKR